jgi:hypothetical protein
MSRVDLSTWTPEQVDSYGNMYHELKEACGDKPLALTPDQRDILTQLGLIPPLSAMVEVNVEGKVYRGLLSLDDDDIYRGDIHLQKD